MKVKFAVCFVVSMAFMPIGAYADIYKWTDGSGVTHYSDKPKKGAEPVHLAPIKTVSPNQFPPGVTAGNPAPDVIPSPVMPSAAQYKASRAAAAAVAYQSVKVVLPNNNETIRNNEGVVLVEVTVIPQLGEQEKLQLNVDGQASGEPQGNTSFKLNNVYRGAHQLSATVVDAHGKSLHDSETITFYMQRPGVNVNNPNNPNNPNHKPH